MTDSSLSHTTHTAPVVDSLIISKASVLESLPLNSALNDLEEEDYTIKCICGFQEDDGNTVFCEQCNTWQHVDCYYYKKDPPGDDDEHGCADCTPELELDAKRAADRQKKRREQIHTVNLKAKKIPGKSHKKKIRPYDYSGVHTNGWLENGQETAHPRNGHAGSPKDQHPPAKRVKTSHRPSHSHNISQNGAGHTGRRSASASHTVYSPTKPSISYTPIGYYNECYSPEFLHLYEDDPGDAPLLANSFNDIQVANYLSLWSNDIEALNVVANGRTHQDIFMRCDQSMDSMPLPQLQKGNKTDESKDYDGLHPSWTYLMIDEYRPQNSIVGELRGKIGHMDDYVQDPSNRWEYLRHPLPFVFFHPHLPIYIDTRKEGTSCRYLRRSCTPNLVMKTILENGSDYHFCFMANQDLEAGTELTVGWTLDIHMRKFLQQKNDGIKQEGAADTDESYAAEWVGRVLADFGGCACDSPKECSMAKYDRRNGSFTGDSAVYRSGKSTKKQKSRSHVPSQSTGRTTTSRSGSEAIKRYEDDENDDSRSTSPSARSKPNSRELTPSNNATSDGTVAGGEEISPRIKEKIKKLEKCQPPKRRKRASGGSVANTPTAAPTGHGFHITKSPYSDETWDHKMDHHSGHLLSQPDTPAAASKPQYIDTGTLQKYSGSPISRSPLATTAVSANVSPHMSISSKTVSLVHSDYVDSSMQTDPDPEHDWATGNIPSPPRRPFISLTKRLLMRCHKEKIESEKAREVFENGPDPRGQVEDLPGISIAAGMRSEQYDSNGDTIMHDEDHVSPPPNISSDVTVEKPRPPDKSLQQLDESIQDQVSPLKPPPIPQIWPSPQISNRKQPINGFRAADLRVQLPPKQLFSGSPTTPSVITTPNSISGSMAQSPLIHTPNSYHPPFSTSSSNIVTPSPAVKKLSLSDYMSSRRGSHKVDTTISATPSATDATPHPPADSSSPTLTHITLKEPENIADEITYHHTDGTAVHEAPDIQNEELLAHKMDTT